MFLNSLLKHTQKFLCLLLELIVHFCWIYLFIISYFKAPFSAPIFIYHLRSSKHAIASLFTSSNKHLNLSFPKPEMENRSNMRHKDKCSWKRNRISSACVNALVWAMVTAINQIGKLGQKECMLLYMHLTVDPGSTSGPQPNFGLVAKLIGQKLIGRKTMCIKG